MRRIVSPVAVLIAVLAVGCTTTPGALSTPSGSADPTQAPATASSSPVATSAPSPTTSPTLSPEPALWSGLRWSAGVPGRSDKADTPFIADILPWADGYVGVGSAFFTSPDGLHWTISHKVVPAAPDAAQEPAFLVRAGTGILAVSDNDGFAPPNLWRSEDGATWTVVDAPSLRHAWKDANLLTVVGGSAGLLAIGSEGLSLMPPGAPVVVYSRDGVAWSRLDLPAAFDHAIFSDALAGDDGFVIVGRDGKPDATPELGGAQGVGRPAAWISKDGRVWTAARVDGDSVAGGVLSSVSAGSTGYFALGRADASRTMSGWVSTDGASWRLIGKIGTDLPDATLVAGDRTRIVLLGRESCRTTELAGWISSNGSTWMRLEFSGSTATPDAVAGPICQPDGTEGWTEGGMVLTSAMVLPDGVLITGSGAIAQEFWFATPTGP